MNPLSGLSFAAALVLLAPAVPALGQSAAPAPLRLSLPENPAPSPIRAGRYLGPAMRLDGRANGEIVRPAVAAPCNCDAALVRLTFTTYGDDGRDVLAAPRTGAFSSAPIGSASWAPRRLYEPFVDSLKAGRRGVSWVLTGKLFNEEPSGLRHVFHLGPSPSNP